MEMLEEDDYVGTIESCSNVINFCSKMSLDNQIKSDAFFYRGFSKLLLDKYMGAIRDFDQSIKFNSEISQVDEFLKVASNRQYAETNGFYFQKL